MNSGLKNYTKQLKHSVGKATAHVNLFKRDANLHITVPLISTKGLSPFETSLIYNYQDRNENGLFGKGFKLNHYALLLENEFTVDVKNADGSTDYYELGEWNLETQNKATRIEPDSYLDPSHIEFEDRNGNKIIYGSYMLYPNQIIMKSGDVFTLDMSSATRTISNGKGDVITFVPNTAGKIEEIIYSYNNTVLEKVKLLYAGEYIETIQYLTSDNVVTNELELTYSATQITIKDTFSKYNSIFNISSNAISSVVDYYESIDANAQTVSKATHTTTIEYGTNCTKVTSWDGTYVEYYFDSQGIPLYQMNNYGYVVETEYNSISKTLVAQSSPFYISGTGTNYFSGQSAANFTLSNVTREEVALAETKWQSLFGNTVYKFSHTGNSNVGTIIFDVPIDCIATDNVTSMIWARQKTNFNNNASVRIDMLIGDNDVDYLKKPVADDNFEFISLGANCKKTESSARFIISMCGDSSFELGSIKLFRQDFGTFFEYDENTNNMTLVSKAGENAKMSYGSDNKLKKMSGFDSTIYNFEYNEDGYPTKSTSAYGVKIENEYSTSFPSRLVKQTLKDRSNSKIMETQKVYSTDGRHLLEEYDEMGARVLSATYTPDDKLQKLTDPNGMITGFDRQNDLLMNLFLFRTTPFDPLSMATYEYYDDRKLKSITLKNGSKYEFFYDFRGNVTEIKLNGVLVFSYTYYENTGNVQFQKYGPTGDMYGFAYNEDNLLSEVYYFSSASSSPTLRFSYVYNTKKQLARIVDAINNFSYIYTYDSDGSVIKITNSATGSVEYTHDNLGNINTLLRTVQNNKIHESFSNASRSQSEHPQKMKDRFGASDYFGLFDEYNATLTYGENELNPLSTGFTYGREGMLPFINMREDRPLSYRLTDYYAGNYENGCVKFWFKPTQTERIQYLFGIQGTNGDYITVHCESENLRVEIKENGQNARTILTSSDRVIENKWNFFALNFYFQHDDNTSANSEISLTLNANTQFYTTTGTLLDITLDTNPTYHIGRRYDGVDTEAFVGKIACLAIAPRWYSPYDNIKKYYTITKDYIDDCQFVDGNLQTLDVSETVTLNLSNAITNEFEVYPLNNNVMSITGKRPIGYKRRDGVAEDKDKSFNFNIDTKRYAYVADGSELVYSFGQSNAGTILMRAYTEAINNKQYLFEGKDANGKKLGLYRDGNNRIHVVCDGEDTNTNLSMSNNVWHTVGLTFLKDSSSSIVEVYLDEQSREFSTPIDFTDIKVSIGRRYDEEIVYHHTGNSHECYPFYGQIEMLCASTTYADVGDLDSLGAAINPITKTTEFDDFGRVKQNCIHNADSEVLMNIVTYGTRTNTQYTSQYVNSEEFLLNNTSFTRSYTYDAMGRINSITDNTNGSHTYTYHDNGYLKTEDSTAFTYDDNGNIVKIGTTGFTYDSTIKDKLVKVGNNAITYSAANPLAPKTYKGYTYTFEGRRLVGLVRTSTSGNQTFTYVYDDQGLRVMKILPANRKIRYMYNGSQLMSEIGPDYRLDFLYDENGQLYGFIKNGTYKYFYVRDILKNILGIIDSSGNLVVKYNCTAYGNCTVTLDTDDGLANLNPFRYKGYYYDRESDMYYCHSRYYVPEWCRWLNADSPNFLQPESLNGMNLFTYCGNDPVNCVDPTGCWGIGALFAITAVSMVIGGIAQLITNAISGKRDSEIWRGVAGAAIGAGVNSLALCLSLPMGGASLAISAAAGSLAQTGVDTLESVIRDEQIDWRQTAVNLGVNFTTSLAGNYIGGKIIPTNAGWFQPKKILSVFTKPYGQKIMSQTAIGAGISFIANSNKKNEEEDSASKIPDLLLWF